MRSFATGWMVLSGALLVLCAPGMAQELDLFGEPAECFPTASKDATNGQVKIEVLGRLELPDEMRVLACLKLEGESRAEHWTKTVVQKRAFKLVMGPFRKQLLPGAYRVEVWFDLSKQPYYLQREMLSAHQGEGIKPDHQEILAVGTFTWGSDIEVRQARHDVEQLIRGQAEGARALEQRLHKALSRSIPEVGEASFDAFEQEWTNLERSLLADAAAAESPLTEFEQRHVLVPRGDLFYELKEILRYQRGAIEGYGAEVRAARKQAVNTERSRLMLEELERKLR